MADNSLKIIAGYAQIDQDHGITITQDIAHYQSRLQVIHQAGIKPIQLTIEPLSTDWHSLIGPNNFRSGCAPIMALTRAQELIAQGHHAVIIGGDDALKTGYQRQERHLLMAIYRDDYSIAQLYDDLAHQFIKHHAIDSKEFIKLTECLFNNHTASHQLAKQRQRAHFPAPEPKWFNQVTSLFRGVDCANPLVDFSGRLLLCSADLAQQLAFEQATTVGVAGVGLGLLDIDETTELPQIAQYKHLAAAYRQACSQAKVDFGQAVIEQRALMEIYTCYPVVPLAFLLSSGLVNSLEQVPEFLTKHFVTITGGMNLARAPWNNPALHGLIAMYHELSNSEKDYGMVHGNGGIGYRQGIAILKCSTSH